MEIAYFAKRVARMLRWWIGVLFLKLFRFWEFFGIHVTPAHFYYPIPLSADLHDELFERKSECIGLNWNSIVQISNLKDVFPLFSGERKFQKNPGLSVVDAAIYYSMIRHHQPKKLIEVGGGFSTRIAIDACQRNKKEGTNCELIIIDPYPVRFLERELPEFAKLIPQKVQLIDVALFQDCDLLFIDSTHIVKMGGDVNYELLEIVPRLKRGCLVHFHDILLPGEYWKEWVIKQRYFWTEQYLLWAFLLFNNAFELVWASRYMHLRESVLR